MQSPPRDQVTFQISPAQRTPLSVIVSRQLRDAILSGQISAGTELPSEHELAVQFAVGRSTVREAVRILQAQGLLSGGDTVSTRRPRVSSDDGLNAAAAQAMENALRLGQIPIDDLVELRIVLEGAMIEQAARSGSQALGEAHAALQDMVLAQHDAEAYLDADLRFHQGLAAASGNVAMQLMMGVLRSAVAGHLGAALNNLTDVGPTAAQLTDEHAAIYLAVAEGRGDDARKLLMHHLRGFYQPRRAS